MTVYAICGDSGSGKTTIANRFKEEIGDALVLECDRYHKWERGDWHWDHITHLNPSAIEIMLMFGDIYSLREGRNIVRRDYDHKTGKFTEPQIIAPRKHLIVCGLHSLYIVPELYDYTIYVDTDPELKRRWKIKRDVEERGYSVDSVIENMERREPDFHKYIEPQKKYADYIIRFRE